MPGDGATVRGAGGTQNKHADRDGAVVDHRLLEVHRGCCLEAASPFHPHVLVAARVEAVGLRAAGEVLRCTRMRRSARTETTRTATRVVPGAGGRLSA